MSYINFCRCSSSKAISQINTSTTLTVLARVNRPIQHSAAVKEVCYVSTPPALFYFHSQMLTTLFSSKPSQEAIFSTTTFSCQCPLSTQYYTGSGCETCPDGLTVVAGAFTTCLWFVPFDFETVQRMPD